MLCALALPAAAQTSGEASATPSASTQTVGLTLEECVARAMQKNFDIKIQGFSTETAKESLNVANADYNPVFTATAGKSGSQAYSTLVNTNGNETRVGIAQKVVTGASVSLSTSLDKSKASPASSALNPAYNADVSLSITQPLLKNAGTSVNKAAINRARVGVERAGLDYKSQVLSVVRDVERAYYTLCYARGQLAVRNNSMQLAQTLLDESKERKLAGVATELDVLQAEVGAANARKNLLDAQKAAKDAEDSLLNLIGQFELGAPIGVVTFPAYNDPAPSFDHSYKLARESMPEFLSAQAATRQYEIDANTSKNARLPSLDLGTAVGYNTREGSSSKALSELPGSDGYSWQVDLSFKMPWGLKAENARYRSAVHTLNQSRMRQQQLEQNLMVQVRTAVRSVETNVESVQILAKATELSVKKYELEKAKYSTGQSTPRRVLEAQDDLESARVSELQSQVALRSAVAELKRLEGSSLEKFGIKLP